MGCHPESYCAVYRGFGAPSESNLVVIQRSDTVGTTVLTMLGAIARIFVEGSTRGFPSMICAAVWRNRSSLTPFSAIYPAEVRAWLAEMPIQGEAHTYDNIYIQPGRFYLVYENSAVGVLTT